MPLWRSALLCVISMAVLFAVGCSEIKRTAPERYFASTGLPTEQELRWSNGRTPKTADPAVAKAAPETDVVRAIYEGLTELNAGNLSVIPAAAESWRISEDSKTWTFEIRQTAVWSDGTPLTAEDFRRSWHRASKAGNGSNASYFENISGMTANVKKTPMIDETATSGLLNSLTLGRSASPGNSTANGNTVVSSDSDGGKITDSGQSESGITTGGEKTLIVRLVEPDPDFARLVAHPVFRPVHPNDAGKTDSGISAMTNGAFVLEKQDSEGVVLKRSDSYWNKSSVKLERIKIIPSETAEKALEAYRTGKVDAITNAEFSPLVLKLLTPYEDLKKTTFAALNYYEINLDKPQFKDRRIREALAIAIERERLTEGELEGTTQPALTFTPFGPPSNERLVQDKALAKDLFEDAGYPNGRDFPKITLYINRNDTQQRIARSVAAMWKDVLNVDCEIVVKDASDLEKVRENKEFDLIRRGVVLSTPNKLNNLKTIFGNNTRPVEQSADSRQTDKNGRDLPPADREPDTLLPPDSAPSGLSDIIQGRSIITQAEALHQVYAIPLYFPISFSLVKPYIEGFEANNLDAQYLQEVSIDETWYQGNAE